MKRSLKISWTKNLTLKVCALILSNGIAATAFAYDFTEAVASGTTLSLGQIDCVTINQISVKAAQPEEASASTVIHTDWYGFKKDYVLGASQLEKHNGTSWIRLSLNNVEKPEVSEYDIYLFDVGVNPEAGSELTGYMGNLLHDETKNTETGEIVRKPIGFAPWLAISCHLQLAPQH